MKSSHLQFETMVTFMEENGDLSKPSTNSRGKIETLRSWETLTSLLNSDGTGDTKPTEKWKKVWSDLKNNTKKKAARLHRAASGTGGGPAVFAKLTDLEQRVLNLIGHQVATGLPLEEAGFSQNIPNELDVEASDPVAVILDSQQVEENVELWDQPGPSHQVHIPPPVSTPSLHSHENEEATEGREVSPLVSLQPASAGQTGTQRSPRRSVRGSPRRIARGSPRGPVRRRSPRRLIRPARSEEAAQHFLNSDQEWRKFRMDQHRDYMDLKREQNRIREMELQTQREWQAVALRGLDVIEKIANNFK